MTWTLKQDENGNAILQDGLPVYVKPDGTEVPYDVNKAQKTIHDLGRENQSWREKYQSANEIASKYKDLDYEEVQKALKIAEGLDSKQILEAGEYEQRIAAVKRPLEEQLAAAQQELANLRQSNAISKIKSGIAASPFMKQAAASPDTLHTLLRDNFKIEQDGSVYAVDSNGNKILNDSGHVATVEEAVVVLMHNHPDLALFTKPSGNQGANVNSNGGRQGVPSSLAECKTDEEKIAYLRQSSKGK